MVGRGRFRLRKVLCTALEDRVALQQMAVAQRRTSGQICTRVTFLGPQTAWIGVLYHASRSTSPQVLQTHVEWLGRIRMAQCDWGRCSSLVWATHLLDAISAVHDDGCSKHQNMIVANDCSTSPIPALGLCPLSTWALEGQQLTPDPRR